MGEEKSVDELTKEFYKGIIPDNVLGDKEFIKCVNINPFYNMSIKLFGYVENAEKQIVKKIKFYK